MLTAENLNEFAERLQTTDQNVVREYVQHLFLSSLYGMKRAGGLFFKGGTALRIVFQSPRFSEDLDFTGVGIYQREIDELFIGALSEMENIGIDVSLGEAKSTTGGYLGLIHYKIFAFSADMKFEVSLRKGKKTGGEITNIVSDFTAPYTLIHLRAEEMVREKAAALLARRKPRDYYDLYYILRHPALNRMLDKKRLGTILKNLESERIDFRRELSPFLPAGHQLIVRNFRKILSKEIGKYL